MCWLGRACAHLGVAPPGAIQLNIVFVIFRVCHHGADEVMQNTTGRHALDIFTHMALNAVGLNGELMRQLRGTMKAIARLFPQRADLRSFSFRNKNPGALRARILREPNQPQGMGSFPAAEIPVRSGLLSNRRTDYYDVNDSPGPLQRFR